MLLIINQLVCIWDGLSKTLPPNKPLPSSQINNTKTKPECHHCFFRLCLLSFSSSLLFSFPLLSLLWFSALSDTKETLTLVSSPNDGRNSILMTRHYPDLGRSSDWLNQISHAARPISSTTQIWVVTRHQYGISVLFLRRNLAGKPVVASPNVGCFLRLIYSFHQKRSNDYALLR